MSESSICPFDWSAYMDSVDRAIEELRGVPPGEIERMMLDRLQQEIQMEIDRGILAEMVGRL